MKRAAILVAILLAVPLARAQEPSKPPEPVPTPATQPPDSNANPQPAAPVQVYQPIQVPKTGHPLDPHDVDVLTGKADRDARAAQPINPYLWPGGYGQGMYGWNYGGRGQFSRFAFGGFGGRPFFFFGNPFFAPQGFFFGHGGGGRHFPHFHL